MRLSDNLYHRPREPTFIRSGKTGQTVMGYALDSAFELTFRVSGDSRTSRAIKAAGNQIEKIASKEERISIDLTNLKNGDIKVSRVAKGLSDDDLEKQAKKIANLIIDTLDIFWGF